MRNRVDIAVRSLLLGASVAMTAALVTMGIIELNHAKGLASVTGKHMLEITENIKNSGVMQYDGMAVSGSEVVSFAKKYLGDVEDDQECIFRITVNNDGKTFHYTSAGDLTDMKNSGSAAYVKPVWYYRAEVVKNGNGIITEVVFTKV